MTWLSSWTQLRKSSTIWPAKWVIEFTFLLSSCHFLILSFFVLSLYLVPFRAFPSSSLPPPILLFGFFSSSLLSLFVFSVLIGFLSLLLTSLSLLFFFLRFHLTCSCFSLFFFWVAPCLLTLSFLSLFVLLLHFDSLFTLFSFSLALPFSLQLKTDKIIWCLLFFIFAAIVAVVVLSLTGTSIKANIDSGLHLDFSFSRCFSLLLVRHGWEEGKWQDGFMILIPLLLILLCPHRLHQWRVIAVNSVLRLFYLLNAKETSWFNRHSSSVTVRLSSVSCYSVPCVWYFVFSSTLSY